MMNQKIKKVTISSRWGVLPPATFRILSITPNGNYIVSYSSAKKAQRNNSGDYYPGLEVYERSCFFDDDFASVNVHRAKII